MSACHLLIVKKLIVGSRYFLSLVNCLEECTTSSLEKMRTLTCMSAANSKEKGTTYGQEEDEDTYFHNNKEKGMTYGQEEDEDTYFHVSQWKNEDLLACQLLTAARQDTYLHASC